MESLQSDADPELVARSVDARSRTVGDTMSTAVLSQPRATMVSVARASSQIPLLGRADELHRLCSAVASARAGDPSMVLLAGDAGVGKTRLLRELGEWALGRSVHP